MSEFKKSFGANLKSLRKERGITQERLSEMIDVHPQQVSKIETGTYFPSAGTIEKICSALNITPGALFDFDRVKDEEFLNKLNEIISETEELTKKLKEFGRRFGSKY